MGIQNEGNILDEIQEVANRSHGGWADEFNRLARSSSEEANKRRIEIRDLYSAAYNMLALGYTPGEVYVTGIPIIGDHLLRLESKFIEQLDANSSTKAIRCSIASKRVQMAFGEDQPALAEFDQLVKETDFSIAESDVEDQERSASWPDQLLIVMEGLKRLADIHQGEWLHDHARIEALVQAAFDLLATGYSVETAYMATQSAFFFHFRESLDLWMNEIDGDPALRDS